ncbi:uncharacterized protein LOC117319398, partial [Pecten maximus]|uniref:uncharacterized protein LOC117319398 n=1 Tax=Pecten maximus TaxID=6579 RepID=UPI001458D2C3
MSLYLFPGTPRRNNTLNSVIEAGGNVGKTTTLSVTVIANPLPTAKWSVGVTPLPIIRNSGYQFIISGEVITSLPSDFKKYHLSLTNGIPGELMVTFQIRSEDIPYTAKASPAFSLPAIILSVIVVILTVALVIVISVKRRRRAEPAQEQRCEVPTRDQELQDIANPTGFQCSAVQEQEHVYASVDDGITDLQEIPGKATRNEHQITANINGADDKYLKIEQPRGGAGVVIDDDKYIQMKQPKGK